MGSPKFNGGLFNLTYLPTFIKYKKIKEFYKTKPNLESRESN